MREISERSGANRRELIAGGVATAAILVIRPARATDETMRHAIREFIGEAQVRPGRIRLDLPPLVENGNAVPLALSVESPMTADDHVKRIAVFNQKNPQPNVAIF